MDPAKGGLTRSTAVRRALDQLVQELAVSKVREEVHPILKARVVDIGIPKHLVKKVRAVVYEKAERLTRKGVHQQLREAFDAVAESLAPPGTAATAPGRGVLCFHPRSSLRARPGRPLP